MKKTLKSISSALGLDKVDWQKATTRLLIVLWITLIIAWIMKMCCGNLFEIVAKNTWFTNICNTIGNNPVLSKIYPFPFYLLSCYLAVLTIGRNKPKKWHWWLILIFTILYIIKAFNEYIGMGLEFIFIYIFISIKETKHIWAGLETYLIMFIFQLISLLTKNIGYKLTNENLIISSIYMIDYYIMMGIYCVNVIERKEGIVMGLFGPILLSKKGKQLVAYRNKLVEKKVKLDKRIKDLDKAIEDEKAKAE